MSIHTYESPQITHIVGRPYKRETAARFAGESTRLSANEKGGKTEDTPCNPDCNPGCCNPQCEPSICDPEVCDPDGCAPLCPPYRCDPEWTCAPDACLPNCDPNCCPNEPCDPDGPCDPSPTIAADSQFSVLDGDISDFDPCNWTQAIYFCPWVVFEQGAVNGAILDFRTGNVLSLNHNAQKIALRIARGTSLSRLAKWLNKTAEKDDGDLESFISDLAAMKVLTRQPPVEDSKRYLAEPQLRNGLQFLWLEVTSGCNLRCVHCYAECGTEKVDNYVATANLRTRTNKNLSVSGMFAVISQAAATGCRRMQFIGGEPTLHPKLLDMIRHADEEGFRFIEVYTNGTWLTDTMLSEFKRLGVHVAISFYSHDKDIHESITAIPGSYDRTISSLEKLKHLEIPFRVGIVVMKQNEGTMEQTRKFLQEKGYANSVRADGLRPSGRGTNDNNMPIDYDSVQRTPGFRADWFDYNVNKKRNSCWYGKVAVSAIGDVMPCIFSRDEILGNVHEQPLDEIVNAQRTQSLWHITHDQVAVCNQCEYKYVCRDCRALPLNGKGELLGQSPRCGYNPLTGFWSRQPAMI